MQFWRRHQEPEDTSENGVGMGQHFDVIRDGCSLSIFASEFRPSYNSSRNIVSVPPKDQQTDM
ncbi:MAG: hypothetical protein JW739_05820 [Opitutales bacterium]|nr:hypothetical protein [Opitutales bacterium]